MKGGRTWYSVSWKELLVLLGLLCVGVLLLFPGITPTWSATQRVRCQDNLKRLGTALRVYAQEDPGELYPRLHGYGRIRSTSEASGCENVFDDFDYAPDMRALYPDYVDEPLVLVCEAGPYGTRPRLLFGRFTIGSLGYAQEATDAVGIVRDGGSNTCQYTGDVTNGDVSYTYLPWVVGDETPGFRSEPLVDQATAAELGLDAGGPAQLVAVAAQLRKAQSLDPNSSGSLLDADIILAELYGPSHDSYSLAGCETGGKKQTVLWRVALGVERKLTDPSASTPEGESIAQSDIPLLFDTISESPSAFAHIPGGSNVLYMDGHVEFIKYPGQFPICEAWARLMPVVKQ
ncbi:MAG: H-X9-DG-CTERM domain-containing protein [Candidatus Hydrogenedentales bacterium]|jgi:prepilin-type processing-associated H-X9-DG protein